MVQLDHYLELFAQQGEAQFVVGILRFQPFEQKMLSIADCVHQAVVALRRDFLAVGERILERIAL